MKAIAVFGAGGGLGQALIAHVQAKQPDLHIFAVSQRPAPASMKNANIHWFQIGGYGAEAQREQGFAEQVQTLCEQWQSEGVVLHGVLSTLGWLHQQEWQPERRIEQLNEAQLMAYFHGNAVLPIIVLQVVKPLLVKKEPAFVVQLGAKVGSIGDNELGGWYGYRASKAALNMLFKTASIEFKRTHKQLSLAVIHPGTTDTKLSEPFQERLSKDKLYTPEQSAARIWQVIDNLKPEQSGGFWFWDGTSLPW